MAYEALGFTIPSPPPIRKASYDDELGWHVHSRYWKDMSAMSGKDIHSRASLLSVAKSPWHQKYKSRDDQAMITLTAVVQSICTSLWWLHPLHRCQWWYCKEYEGLRLRWKASPLHWKETRILDTIWDNYAWCENFQEFGDEILWPTNFEPTDINTFTISFGH